MEGYFLILCFTFFGLYLNYKNLHATKSLIKLLIGGILLVIISLSFNMKTRGDIEEFSIHPINDSLILGLMILIWGINFVKLKIIIY